MRRFTGALLTLAVAACMTTGEKMSRLREGMTKDEIVAILGDPDGFQRSGQYEALKYLHRLVTGWAWDRGDYFVILKDGRVVEYGVGEIRERDVGVLVVVPLR